MIQRLEVRSADDSAIPHDLEAEQNVLGSLLLDGTAIVTVTQTLRPTDFYLEAHQQIFSVMVDLYEARRPLDYQTVVTELRRRDVLPRVGDAGYVLSLSTMVPVAIHVEAYAETVSRLSLKRRLITAGNRITSIGYDVSKEADEALDDAEKALYEVSRDRASHGFASIAEILADYLDRLDYIHENRGKTVGVPSGFIDLDKLTGGLQRSDMIVVAGRPSMGKTAWALSLIHKSALRFRTKTAYFSLEMSKEQLVQRLLCMEGGLDSGRLRSGDITEAEWGRLIQAAAALSETQIFIDDSASISTMEMRGKARRLQAEQGLDLIVVDYLQLMQGRNSENRVQEISAISRALKGLARELNVPVIALSQVSRAVDARSNHVPLLSDLRESGCLAGDTPVYLPDEGVYRPIAELVGSSGFRVLALNPATWRLEPAPVTRAFATGVKPIYCLTTRLGRAIRATANHKFLTLQGWKRLDQLVPGERIALPRVLPASTQSATMSDAELALLGHLIGDGCTLPSHAVQYTTNELALAETVVQLATQVFGDTVVPRISREQRWYQVYLAAGERLTHGKHNPITTWLTAMGAFGLRSHEKHVPACVFAQPTAGVARFLRHLWVTDGCIHLGLTKKPIPRIYYASSSERLARNVQSLLLRLSINARLNRVLQPGKGRDQFHVVLSGKGDIERFLTTIGGLGASKAAHHNAISVHNHVKVANTNHDVLPREAWSQIVFPAMREARLTTRQMQAGLDTACCGTTLYKACLGRERATRLAHVVASPQLALLAASDVYWDEIDAVEPAGQAPVYDLTVDSLHNFVAGDIVVHNSIEQDSDIVIFIYRDEVYNEDTEKKNIADIHVAKHRNGPTGVFSLYFNKSQAHFVDLDTTIGTPSAP